MIEQLSKSNSSKILFWEPYLAEGNSVYSNSNSHGNSNRNNHSILYKFKD